MRVPHGRTVDRKGNPVMLKLKGRVEAFYRWRAGGRDGAAESGQPAP